MRTVQEAEKWVSEYAKEHGGRQQCIYGQCIEFSNDFKEWIGAGGAEIWGLFEVYDKGMSDKFPLVFKGNLKLPEGQDLSDVGWEIHEAVRWSGFWWDGYGKQSLSDIMTHFDTIKNPHWFRLE